MKAYITNFLERDCVGDWMGRETHHIVANRKTIKADSTELSKSVTPTENTEVPLWEN